ncbi:metallophosphoesterase [soil metagenome]
MKIICIADTHNKHDSIAIPPGDIIIHAGDFTEAGTRNETFQFLDWFAALPHTYKILIGGNHDFYLEKNNDNLKEIIPPNVHYLKESGICIDNVNFWGSPVTPGNGNWAFNLTQGNDLLNHWNLIPKNTDFLITHSPPFMILDELNSRRHIGCLYLQKKVQELQIPYHIFGHNHNDYGIERTRNTVFVNASSMDDRYRLINYPLVIHHKLS